MKKIIPLIAMLGVLVLAGCNQSNDNGTTTPSGNATMTSNNATAGTNSAPAQ